ncbi:MAG: efflux transporter periplasmic adaptor subunit, partial [Zoogloeaceae bacterium]|nr:efflux transporter periplasmic adaptor subunit [Zoogloeaceae bacterium]
MVKQHRVWVIALALAGLVAAAVIAQIAQPSSAPRPVQGDARAGTPPAPAAAGPRSGDAGQAVAVETTRVVHERVQAEATAVGTLKSNESVVLRPETSGRIEAIHFKDGAMVKAG